MLRNEADDLFYTRETISSLFNVISHIVIDTETTIFVGDDKSIGIIWRCSPLTGGNASTQEMLKAALSIDMPDHSIITVSQWASPFIERILNLHARARGDILGRQDGLSLEQKKLLIRTADRRREFIRSGTQKSLYRNKDLLLKDSQIIVTLKIPVKRQAALMTWDDLEPLVSAALNFESAIKTAELSPIRMKASDYLYAMRSFFSVGQQGVETWFDERRKLNEQIVPFNASLQIENDHLKYNNRVIKSMSVAGYPKEAHLGMMNYLIGDPKGGSNQIRDPYLLTTMVYYPPYSEEKSSIQSQANWIAKMAKGPIAATDQRIGIKHQGYQTLISSVENRNRPVKIWTNLTIFSDSEERATKTAVQVKTYYQTIGFDLKDDLKVQAPCFLNVLPMGAELKFVKQICRWNTVTVEHAANVLPVIGEWVGTGTGAGNIFIGRRGQVMLWDPFDSDGAYNITIAAASGSGKSFLSNYLAIAGLQKSAKYRIIDQGNSYKKLASSIKGQFIAFSDTSNICLNPFTHIRDYDEEQETLVTSLAAMAAPNEGLTDYQLAKLSTTCKKVYENTLNKTTITDIAAACNESDDPELKRIGGMLEPWDRHNANGKWFDGDNNLNYSNQFVVLELDDLKTKKTLQTVVLMQIINRITQEVYILNKQNEGGTPIPYYLFVDEAWEQLQDPKVVKFMEGASRRFRKYKASLCIITQNLGDLYLSAPGEAIAQNTYHFVVMRQTSASVDTLKKTARFPIGEYGFAMLETIHTAKGQYSEMFYLSGAAQGVGQLVVDRFSQLLYTTDRDEVSRIEYLMQQRKLSTEDAIDEYIRLEAAGEVASIGQ